MKQIRFVSLFAAGLALAATGLAQEPKPVALPKPQLNAGKSLMQALAERKTTREFTSEDLSPQMLSNLLWAAFGVNREAMAQEEGRATAPSAMNRQEIQIYVLLPEGVFLYDAALRAEADRGGAFARRQVELPRRMRQ